MAVTYLTRHPIAESNRRCWTWSCWVKNYTERGSGHLLYTTQGSTPYLQVGRFLAHNTPATSGKFSGGKIGIVRNEGGGTVDITSSKYYRDFGAWYHVLIQWDTTRDTQSDRHNLWINGVRQPYTGTSVSQHYEGAINRDVKHTIGAVLAGNPLVPVGAFQGQMCDVFFIEGQYLNPDSFGYYKTDTSYSSQGLGPDTEEFKPGQWYPKSPSLIKSCIEESGGFGTNGYYLPMNSSNNYGADFHCEPNTILKVKENLPQPKAEIDGNGSYVDALRNDPYKDSLVLAIPFVLGGLNNGIGDYSHIIKGFGSPKNVRKNGNPGIQRQHSVFYGSSLGMNIGDDSSANEWIEAGPHPDFYFGGADFTIEGWWWPSRSQTTNARLYGLRSNAAASQNAFDLYLAGSTDADRTGTIMYAGNSISGGASLCTEQWNHVVSMRKGNQFITMINGVTVGIDSMTRTDVGSSSDYFRIGQIGEDYSDPDGYEYRGYVQDVRVYNGVAKYSGGYDCPRPWSPQNFGVNRAINDTPRNKFCTLNSRFQLAGQTGTDSFPKNQYFNGNLTFSTEDTGGTRTRGNMGVKTGKWYYEVRVDTTPSIWAHLVGWVGGNYTDGNGGNGSNFWIRGGNTRSGGGTGVGVWDEGDILMLALDADNKKAWAGRNGIWYDNSQVAQNAGPTPANNMEDNFDQGLEDHFLPAYFVDNVADLKQLTFNFGQDKSMMGRLGSVDRLNASNSSWDQTPNTGNHNDWTISNNGTGFDVAVSSGHYARAYMYLDKTKTYLLNFEYASGPANLGVLGSEDGYLRTIDGVQAPNGLTAGANVEYTFLISGQEWVNFTGFNSQTYQIRNIWITEVKPGYSDDNGKGEFLYKPPAGFLSLCTDNLEQTIDPGKHFKTVIYKGNGDVGRSITNVGFQPDLVWIKARQTTVSHVWTDSVRGAGSHLNSNSNAPASEPSYPYLKSFDEKGFSLFGTSSSGGNIDGRNYVAWCWKAGGAAVSNTEGSLTSQVSANVESGFSIVKYYENGTTGTVGHGLNKAPKIIILKSLDATRDWTLYTTALSGSGYNYIPFNVESTATAGSSLTRPTDRVFSATGVSGENYIAYCWAETEGFSKFGTYYGSGNTDGAFVYCGFKPAMVIIKNIDDATTDRSWAIYDSTRNPCNSVDLDLQAESDGQEGEKASSYGVDFLSNGFKIVSHANWLSLNNKRHLYMAFAECPYSSATAK